MDRNHSLTQTLALTQNETSKQEQTSSMVTTKTDHPEGRRGVKKIASFITIHVEFKFFSDGTCAESDADADAAIPLQPTNG